MKKITDLVIQDATTWENFLELWNIGESSGRSCLIYLEQEYISSKFRTIPARNMKKKDTKCILSHYLEIPVTIVRKKHNVIIPGYYNLIGEYEGKQKYFVTINPIEHIENMHAIVTIKEIQPKHHISPGASR